MKSTLCFLYAKYKKSFKKNNLLYFLSKTLAILTKQAQVLYF